MAPFQRTAPSSIPPNTKPPGKPSQKNSPTPSNLAPKLWA